VGNAGNVQGINGTLNIENPNDQNILNIDDSNDGNSLTTTLSTFTPNGDTPWGAITALAPANTNYEYDDTAGGVAIKTGGGNGAMHVNSASPAVPLMLIGGAGNEIFAFLADTSLGNATINNAGGGIDTISFAGTNTAVSLSLSSTAQ